MLIGFRQPKQNMNMKTNAQLDSSAPTLANTMLVEDFIFRCPSETVPRGDALCRTLFLNAKNYEFE
jgi:hypothetical protein